MIFAWKKGSAKIFCMADSNYKLNQQSKINIFKEGKIS